MQDSSGDRMDIIGHGFFDREIKKHAQDVYQEKTASNRNQEREMFPDRFFPDPFLYSNIKRDR